MSGKGKSSSNSGGGSSSGRGGSSGGSSSSQPQPTVISGWEHSTYANANTNYARERYAYIGKDDSGEPEWLDYGAKGGR